MLHEQLTPSPSLTAAANTSLIHPKRFAADIAGSQYSYHDRGMVHEFQLRSITFYTSKYWYRSLTPSRVSSVSAADEDTPFKPVPIPDDASISTFGSEAMISLRTDWSPPGSDATFSAGSLLTAPMSSVMADDWGEAKCLFEPTDSKSLQSTTTTKDYVVLSVLEDVRTNLVVYKYGDGKVRGNKRRRLLRGGCS